LENLDGYAAHSWDLPFKYMDPFCLAGDPESEFARLKAIWIHEWGTKSFIPVDHWAYRKIIAMGQPVVPILLRELRDEPNWWFNALHVLTGANPGDVRDQGRLKVLAKKWVKWGRKHGYDI
jgi:hypothetical protein